VNNSLLLTKEKFEEILLQIILKGQESKSIRVSELIEEIKEQIILNK
jgi:hypothetical protein